MRGTLAKGISNPALELFAKALIFGMLSAPPHLKNFSGRAGSEQRYTAAPVKVDSVIQPWLFLGSIPGRSVACENLEIRRYK